MVTVPYGPEFTVSNGVYGAEVSVASDTDRFMLVWEGPDAPPGPDQEYNSDYNELWGRTYSVMNPLSGIFQVNTEIDDPQVDPEIIRYGDGSYIVAYRSGFGDSLEGTFVATQRFDVDGVKVGPENYSPDYSNYHREPDVAVLSDRRSVVVTTEEFSIEASIYDASGTITADYDIGFAFGALAAAAVTPHPLIDNRVIVIRQGYTTDEPTDGDLYGLYWQELDVDDGTLGAPQLIQALPDDYDADPSAVTMRSDRVNIVYTVPGDTGGRDIMLYSLPFDGVSAPYATTVNDLAAAGDQLRPTIDAIDDKRVVIAWEDRQLAADDASGSSIRAVVFDSGGPGVVGPIFLVNQVTAGDQAGPSVAQVDEGIFVVAWTDGNGVKARLFDADGATGPVSDLVTRLETQDGSDFLDQRLPGFDGPQSFYFEIGAETGDDRILGFGRNDVLLTSAPLFDGNGDGIIAFRGGLLRLDGRVAGSDTVRLDGLTGPGLRYLGEDAGLSVYAAASVRPDDATEVLLGSAGATGGPGGDLFFFDAALDLPDRSYALTGFGAEDVLVTTAAIADENGDGRIGFGSDQLVRIGGSDFAVARPDGRSVTALEFDGLVEHDGVAYYVYSLVGSVAGTEAVSFG